MAATADRIAALMASANQHEQAGRLDESEKLVRHVLAEAPGHHPAVHLLGVLALRRGRLADAVPLFEQSIARAPNEPLYCRNICELYRLLGRFDEALAAGRRAVALAPGDVVGHHNLSVLHYHRLELDEAIASAEQALAIDPGFAGAHLGIAEAALLGGDLERGWDEYEWRHKLDGVSPLLPSSDRPTWDGAPLPDDVLLLVADQGYGDVIQFARYIPWAARRCPRLAIACSGELQPVVRQYAGAAVLFDHWQKAPDFAAYCALSSLPRLARTRLDTIPSSATLQPDPALSADWARRLDTLLPRGYRRIGIVWAGRPTHRNDQSRSTGLHTLMPLADLPRTALVSLQKGPAAAEIGGYWGRAPLVNVGPELGDFGDTMAVLDNVELTVTVDTSVAHLAGAMAKPALVMLPYAPDWRWLLRRCDSPWYPSLRLCRQGPDRSWAPVIDAIVERIRLPDREPPARS